MVLATGYKVWEQGNFPAFPVFGRAGVELGDWWDKNRFQAYEGITVPGFPNLFIFSLLQSGFSVNFPHMLNEQAIHLAYILEHAAAHDVTVIETSPDAEADWVRTIIELARDNLSFLEACTPGYYNNEGKPNERGARNGFYGAGPIAFVKVLEAWRAAGDLAGHRGTAAGDLANGLEQLVFRRALEQITGRAGHQGLEHLFAVVINGEH